MRLFSLVFLILVTACAFGDKQAGQNNTKFPVLILGGMYLGSLLDAPEKIVSKAGLQAALGKDWYAPIVVSSPDQKGDSKDIKNCINYFTAAQSGKQPVKEFERSAYMEFGLMCLAARDIANAAPATTSYMKGVILGEKTPKEFPRQLSMVVSEAEFEKMLGDKSKIHWADVNQLMSVEKINDFQVVYQNRGGRQELALVAKGDFNKDGVEDVLVTSKDSVVDGSYNAMRMFLLTKYKAGSDYVLLKEYKAI